MGKITYEAALQQIAEKERKTPEQIKAMVQNAIDKAFSSGDESDRKIWTSITENGEKPTVEQVIVNMVEQMSKLKNMY